MLSSSFRRRAAANAIRVEDLDKHIRRKGVLAIQFRQRATENVQPLQRDMLHECLDRRVLAKWNGGSFVYFLNTEMRHDIFAYVVHFMHTELIAFTALN